MKNETLVIVGIDGKVAIPLDETLELIAEESGLYRILWRPNRMYNVPDEDRGMFHGYADELIDALHHELKELTMHKDRYVDLFSAGKYAGLMNVAEKALKAFVDQPSAKVVVVDDYKAWSEGGA